MKYAVLIFTFLTVAFLVAAQWVQLSVRHAEDKWNVVFAGAAAFMCGVIDIILIIIWLAIT